MSRFLQLALFVTLSLGVVNAQNCGPRYNNAVCAAGNCCSQYGWCDVTPAHCAVGCYPSYSGAGSACKGTISSTTTLKTSTIKTSTTSAPPSQSTIPVIDTCGVGSGQRCPGVGTNGYYYRCCSSAGHCGPKNPIQDPAMYCGTGCQPLYGSCDVSRPRPPPPAAAPTQNQQPGGECGPIVNRRCATGECCSGSNFCGNGVDYCGAANWCQSGYGLCA